MEKRFTREMGTKKWLQNFWYYYRWHMIIGGFFLLLVILFIHDIVTQEKVDANILLAVQGPVSQEQTDCLEQLFEGYGDDWDGDGQINYFLNSIIYPVGDDGMSAQTQMAMQTKFIAELSTGETLVMVMDDYTFGQMPDPENYADLSVLGFRTLPDNRRVLLGDAFDCAGTPLEPLKDKLYLVMRAPSEREQKEKKLLFYQNQTDLLARIAADA